MFFLPEINQLRDKLRDLDEVGSTERLTTIIFDALQVGKHSTVKLKTRDPDLSLEQIQQINEDNFHQSFFRKVVSYQKEPRIES